MAPSHLDRRFPRHAFRYGGGGGQGEIQQVENSPTPTPEPAVTTAAPEVIQAQQDTVRENLLKKGLKSTIHAGDTGGWMPMAGAMGIAPGMANATTNKLGT